MQTLFGAGILWGTPLTDYTGTAITNPTPVQFGIAQEIGIDIGFDTKMLYGSQQFPVAVGRGKGKISGKVKAAQVNGAMFNSIMFGQSLTSGIVSDVYDAVGKAIPTTPFTITASTTDAAATFKVPDSGTWSADLGVRDSNGVPMTRVASAPAAGQYTVSAVGVYVFNTGDAGKTVFLNYQYTATSTTAKKSTLVNPLLGYAPSFKAEIYMPFSGKSLIVTLPNCVANKLSIATKLDDFVVPEFAFDAFADAAGNVMTYAMSE